MSDRFDQTNLRALGRQIRALREKRKWSLRRLATNSGVSVAAIQKIEAGSANPSLLAVIAIIEALGESVDRLISASRKTDRVFHVVRGELPKRANGSVDLSPLLADRRMDCTLKAFAARQRMKNGDDQAKGRPLFGYVLDGVLRISLKDGATHELVVGDAFHAAASTPIEWSNPAARRSLVLCISDRNATGDQKGRRKS